MPYTTPEQASRPFITFVPAAVVAAIVIILMTPVFHSSGTTITPPPPSSATNTSARSRFNVGLQPLNEVPTSGSTMIAIHYSVPDASIGTLIVHQGNKVLMRQTKLRGDGTTVFKYVAPAVMHNTNVMLLATLTATKKSANATEVRTMGSSSSFGVTAPAPLPR